MSFYSKSTKKDIIMTNQDEEDSRNYNICRFCEKENISDEVGDHCHLTGKFRGPAHSKCNFIVTQDQNNFIPFVIHNFGNYDCQMFFKKLVDKKNSKVKFDIIPKTNEEYISVTYGCTRFIDSSRFQSSSLCALVKTVVDNSHKKLKDFKEENADNDEILKIVDEIVEEDKTIKDLKKDYPDKVRNLDEALLDFLGESNLKILQTGFPDKWKHLNKKLAYPYEYFKSIDDYQKTVENLEKEHFFSKLKNNCPGDEETERTMDFFKRFNIKNGEELKQLYLKNDVLLLACVFENFLKRSVNEIGINPLYCVSLPGYTWQCGLKYTGINLQTLQDKHMILLIENNIRGGVSNVMGDRDVTSDENKKKLYVDANNLYGQSMCQLLPDDEIEFDKNAKIEDILKTPIDSDNGCFIEVDLKYSDNMEEKTKHFPFAPVNKKIILKILVII